MLYLNRSIARATDRPNKKTLTNFWLVIWAISLSVGWLLPNHYLPWPSFHLEAWVSLILAGIALIVIMRTPGATLISGSSLVALITAFIPFLQYESGMHALSGPAWVTTAYLFGFFLAIMVGIRWESSTPSQMADGLFLAIGIAAIFSVGLQLHQWLALDRLLLWDMGSDGRRPFANFGQPNLLATFLIWGILAAAWGFQRGFLNGVIFIALTAYLLLGIALTASRTAWIAITFLVFAVWLNKNLWHHRQTPWVATGLGAYFFWCLHAKEWLQNLLFLSSQDDLIRMTNELRPQAWKLLIDAAMQQPWFGYGWAHISTAHIQAAVDHPPLYMLFSHSHNLFLDLILWNGLPIALSLIGFFLYWFWRRVKFFQKPEDFLLLMFLFVVGNHAMLEYPLSYAYFLLPTGLVVGILDVRLNARLWRCGGRWVIATKSILGGLLLSLIIRDYFRVENSYLALRYEFANIQTDLPKDPPKVLLLNHLREMIRLARFEPHRNMSREELDWMLSVSNLYPSAGVIHKLAAALVWNQRTEEAQLWLERMCLMVNPLQCEAVNKAWENQGLNDPQIRSVAWPNQTKNDKNQKSDK